VQHQNHPGPTIDYQSTEYSYKLTPGPSDNWTTVPPKKYTFSILNARSQPTGTTTVAVPPTTTTTTEGNSNFGFFGSTQRPTVVHASNNLETSNNIAPPKKYTYNLSEAPKLRFEDTVVHQQQPTQKPFLWLDSDTVGQPSTTHKPFYWSDSPDSPDSPVVQQQPTQNPFSWSSTVVQPAVAVKKYTFRFPDSSSLPPSTTVMPTTLGYFHHDTANQHPKTPNLSPEDRKKLGLVYYKPINEEVYYKPIGKELAQLLDTSSKKQKLSQPPPVLNSFNRIKQAIDQDLEELNFFSENNYEGDDAAVTDPVKKEAPNYYYKYPGKLKLKKAKWQICVCQNPQMAEMAEMAEWQNVKMADMAKSPNGRNGRMAESQMHSTILSFRSVKIENGKMADMAKSPNGRNGKMAEWQNGRMAKSA
jgi:hypothetical protein